MLIISKRKFMFKNVIGGSFITKGGGILEEAPDWIRETILYDLALLMETSSRSRETAATKRPKWL